MRYFIQIGIRVLLFTGFIYFVKEISERELKHKRWIIPYSIVYSIIYGILTIRISAEITMLFSVIMTIGAYRIFFEIKGKENLFYTIIVWLIAILLDILIMNIVNKARERYGLDIESYRMIGSSIMAGVYYIVGKVKGIKRVIRQTKKYIEQILYPMMGIILIYYFLGSICLKNMEESNISMYILTLAVTLLLIVITYIVEQIQIIFLKENIKILSKNNEFYIEKLDEERIRDHNIVFSLNGIKSVANKKSIQLINEMIERYQWSSKTSKKLEQIPSAIHKMIYERISVVEKELKIQIKSQIKNNIIEEISARDFTYYSEALGVAIDNAIEASKESEEKLVFIEISENEKQIKTTIINTFKGSIDIDELGKKNYTSKKEGHGLGLFSILKMKSVKVKTSIRGNKFTCVLLVNKK